MKVWALAYIHLDFVRDMKQIINEFLPTENNTGVK